MSTDDKKVRARRWVNGYAIAGTGVVIAAVIPGSTSAALVAMEGHMCYQIGKIYRDDNYSMQEAVAAARVIGLVSVSAPLIAMEAMNAIVPDLEQLSASLVAISPQNTHQSFLMADQHKLGFPLLSDRDNQVSRKFGLVYQVPEYQQEVYRRAFVNLPFIHGVNTWELPIPATFVIGATAAGCETPRILFSLASPDYTERVEPTDLLLKMAQLLA